MAADAPELQAAGEAVSYYTIFAPTPPSETATK